MKQNLALVCVVLSFQLVVGQSGSFVTTFGTYDSDFGYAIEVGHNKDVVICGASLFPWFVKDVGLIALLDSNGFTKNVLAIDDSFNCITYRDIHVSDSGYIFLGYKRNFQFPYNLHFVLLETDELLNIKRDTKVFISDSLMLMSYCGLIEYNNDVVIAGYALNLQSIRIPYVIKMDRNGIIKRKILSPYSGYSTGFNLKIIKGFRQNEYFLGDHQKNYGAGNRILHLDSTLSIISDTIRLPNYMTLMAELVKTQNNRLLLVTRGMTNGKYYLACMDTTGNLMHFAEYGAVGFYNGLGVKVMAVHNQSIFISSFPTDLSDMYFPIADNKIFVQKMDTAFNVIWEKHIGWDAYFMQSAIKATPDGGCLVLGSVYDKDSMNQRHDVVVFKLDSNGNITGISNIGMMQTEVSVFPNPGHDYFMLEATKAMHGIKIYDQQGRIIKRLSLTEGTNCVAMDDVPSGIYFIQVISSSGDAIATKKWVKSR